jgi:RNA polymerase sigma-70 factor, ECF subfamily
MEQPAIFDEGQLLDRMRSGDSAAVGELLTHHRKRLRRMVELRLDQRVAARVDPSDVIQEAFTDIVQRLPQYLSDPQLPLFLWLRLMVGDRVLKIHRQHLGTQMRDAALDVSLYRGALPKANSAAIAAQLLGRHTSPTQAALRAERLLRVQDALNSLDALDREIIALRNFEELSRQEAAQSLGIEEPAAAKRYIRAIKRLKEALAAMPGGSDLL